MKRSSREIAGFSMVEITLALGITAFCLLAVLGLLAAGLQTQQASIQQTTANEVISDQAGILRAAVRYPPGIADKLDDPYRTLKGHWATVGTPDTLYYTNEGVITGNVNVIGPGAVFRLTLTYLQPPTETTALANIKVTWPAEVDPADPRTGAPAGKVETFIAVNR